jgi:hypothetical protein
MYPRRSGQSGYYGQYSQRPSGGYRGRSQLMNYPAFSVTDRRSPNSASRYDKDNAQENTALNMFRDVSNDSFYRTWEAN